MSTVAPTQSRDRPDVELQMARIRARLKATTEHDRALRVMLVLAHETLRRSTEVAAADAAAGSRPPVAPVTAPVTRDDYAELVRRVQDIAAETVPAGARILVVSRGDDELLVPGFDAGHFPQAPDGRYAGYYPADSDDAVAQLERLRDAGAEYLVLPSTAYWWLDFYGALARHLLTTARVAHHDEHCLILDLRHLNDGVSAS
jgi:transposase